MIEDILKSVRQNTLERLASPLLGSFAVAWCAWNYRFLVILFSDESVTQTFKLIEVVAFPDLRAVCLKGLMLPLASALIYVFLYPYPARFVYRFTLNRQREINSIRKQIEDETPLTREESQRIRDEYREVNRKHIETIDRLTQEVARLQQLQPALGTLVDVSKQESEDKPYPDELEPSQFQLLKVLEIQRGRAAESEIVREAGEKKVKVEFDLGELVRLKLMEKDYSSRDRDFVYTFTHEGRKVLLGGDKVGA